MLNGTANTVLPSLRQLQIDTPNFYSLVVAVLAGIVGILADPRADQHSARSVHLGDHHPGRVRHRGRERVRSWSEARGSLLQLLLNIVVLIVVGVLTLRFVRLLWRRISNRRDRDA